MATGCFEDTRATLALSEIEPPREPLHLIGIDLDGPFLQRPREG